MLRIRREVDKKIGDITSAVQVHLVMSGNYSLEITLQFSVLLSILQFFEICFQSGASKQTTYVSCILHKFCVFRMFYNF